MSDNNKQHIILSVNTFINTFPDENNRVLVCY